MTKETRKKYWVIVDKSCTVFLSLATILFLLMSITYGQRGMWEEANNYMLWAILFTVLISAEHINNKLKELKKKA